MNIFYLHKNPTIAAQYHCNKHVVKMIVEYAQIMSSVHRILDGYLTYEYSINNRKLKRYRLNDERNVVLYKSTMTNHPCILWAMISAENYNFLYNLFTETAHEYFYRYDKSNHKTYDNLAEILKHKPNRLENDYFYDPPLAMPDYCKIEGNAVASYRNYYLQEKRFMLDYKKREKPKWLVMENIYES